ncbi:unnamed protein product [Dovyalis caffra]|uniref:3-hydroxyisobutyryl-CoA hydrolase n=1 Tax=Dovyalis caffra TaxID=77055 RepID=A0AAV1SMN2_9ROSI|nr:unnamed protein product [Dovyalis caffra]
MTTIRHSFDKDVNQISEMTKELKAYEVDPKVKVVILKVAIIDGIVMGGGAGLSMHGRFKIVTENTVFAMPETSIGHFVDVGASYFLSRLPGFFGEYLGLTGTKIRGADMVACGLAIHFVLSKNLHLLESALDKVTSSDTNTISKIIRKFEHKPKESEAENRPEKWILEAVKSMKSACPISLKISLKSIREGRSQELDQCLAREYNIFCHIKRRTVSNDFYEGMRAMLLDKDKNPQWEPAKLELVTDEMVNRYFSRVDEDDWGSLQLPARSNLVDAMRPRL